MKADEPIRINRGRQRDQQGGRFRTLDPVGQGRVQILPGGTDHVTQGLMALRELRRLENQDPESWDWSRVAIIGRNWRELETVAGLCEVADIDVQLAHEDFTATWQLRETQALLEGVWAHRNQPISVELLNGLLAEQPSNRWTDVLQTALDEYALEVGAASRPASEFVHWLGDWCREVRRRQNHLLVTTAHRAKGREFDHVVVLDGDWSRTMPKEDADATRRLFYVALTRARHTLTMMSMDQPSRFVEELRHRPEILKRESPAEWPQLPDQLPALRRRLSLREVNLSFAGRKEAQGPAARCHSKLAARRSTRSRCQNQSLGTEERRRNCGKAGPEVQHPGPYGHQPAEHADRKPACKQPENRSDSSGHRCVGPGQVHGRTPHPATQRPVGSSYTGDLRVL